MRFFKFQGFTKEGKRIEGDLVNTIHGVAIRPFTDLSKPFGYEVEPFSVGQFTGFVDSEGQELFENDYVVYAPADDEEQPDDTEYKIKFRKGSWVLVNASIIDFDVFLNADVAARLIAIEHI